MRNGGRGLIETLLRVPLSAKILLANGAILAAMVAGSLFLVRAEPELAEASPLLLIGGSAVAALVTGATVNAVLVRLALSPLRELEATARDVQRGERQDRASESILADANLLRLTRVFNRMLDRLERERSRRRQLAVRALRTEERARRRLATALHDDTAQRLATHVLRLKEIRSVSSGSERSRLLDEARQEAVETLEEVRRTARGLHPPELDDLGIGPALRAHVRSREAVADTEVEVEAVGLREDVPDEHRIALYRILQEGLSNALAHAGADRIRVRVEQAGPGVRGEVRDDGRGFDVAAAESDPAAGLGLLAMREQAAALGGRVEIDSQPGEGTRVHVMVPVPATGDDPAREDRRI